jgi:hypothetical protein
LNQLDEFNAAAPAPKVVEVKDEFTVPEEQFRQAWIALLSRAMLMTGKGFRVDTPKRRQPKGAAKFRGERRADKVGTTKLSRRLALTQGVSR